MNGTLIGELAERCERQHADIRYYERLGVLTPALRTSAGYRRYNPESAGELAFIKKAQALGFSLDNIKQILDLPSLDALLDPRRGKNAAHQFYIDGVEDREAMIEFLRRLKTGSTQARR